MAGDAPARGGDGGRVDAVGRDRASDDACADASRTVAHPAATHLSVDQRAEALAAGTPPVSRRTLSLVALAVVVLGLGGILLEHLFTSLGLNQAAAPASAPTSSTTTTTVPQLSSSMASLLGISALDPSPAPSIHLVDQSGATFALSQLEGKVVVVSFFDARCQDICPVLAAEVRNADADLGGDRSDVDFVTVNTDPVDTAAVPPPAAVTTTGLASLGNWYFLTGPVGALDAVWRSYDVTVNVYPRTDTVVHNDVLYFVDPAGRLRFRSTPVADEDATGAFTLPQTSVTRSARGIASYASGLVGDR